MTKEFDKISKNIRAHAHIELTINGAEVDIERKYRDDVAYAVNSHNEMVERIAYLEASIAQFLKGRKADTSVRKVKYGSACYCGSWFDVIVGHGDAPKHFEAVSDSGVTITATHKNVVAGGGHGEGGKYVQSTYDVKCVDADGKKCYFGDHEKEIFTITKVIKP